MEDSLYEIGPFRFIYNNEIGKQLYCEETIAIKNKEMILIKGASGSGKSTLLLLLKGIIPEFNSGELQGQILYNGKPLSGDYFQKNLKDILFLFQNPFSQLIYPKVPEEFYFSMENFNYSSKQIDQKRGELKEKYDLDLYWNKKTTELSHGQCQKLVLASLLAIDPNVLLLDEPTAFLDEEARKDFYEWLLRIKGSRTIIIIDHYLKDILPIVDRVLEVNDKGKLEAVGFSLPNNLALNKNLTFVNEQKNIFEDEVELSLNGVSFHYKDQEELLKDVSFNLTAGSILVVKGKNGRGKSTLFKLIAGVLTPLAGTILLKKKKKWIVAKDRHKEIGFVFQNPESHFFYDTIEDELKVIEDLGNKEELNLFLNLFFKDIDLKKSPFLLSEGEKRRLSILMTVFLNKSVILYDEPTFGLDESSISVVRGMILYLKNKGKIQIIISHDEDFQISLSPVVFEIKDNLRPNKIVNLDEKEPSEYVHSWYLFLTALLSLVFLMINKNFVLDLPLLGVLFYFYFKNGLKLRDFKSLLFYSLVFSSSLLLLNIIHPSLDLKKNEIFKFYQFAIYKDALVFSFTNMLRLFFVSFASMASGIVIDYSKVLLYLMSHKKIKLFWGYPVLLAMNSISLFKKELERIKINSKFRQLPFKDRFSVFFPLLVFAIRHSERGALSLVTRGLNEEKSFYFSYGLSKHDRLVFRLFLLFYMALIGVSVLF